MKKYFTLDEWINLFERTGKEQGKILTPHVLQSLSGLSIAAVKKAIQRLNEKGYLLKVAKNFYANKFLMPSLEEVAMILVRPCYISFESALEKHGIISQIPLVLTCATTKKPKSIDTCLGEIFWHHIQRQLFSDFFNEGGILWATPEKALLDYIYISLKVKKGVMPLDEIYWDKLNRNKLSRLLEKYPKSVKDVLLSLPN